MYSESRIAFRMLTAVASTSKGSGNTLESIATSTGPATIAMPMPTQAWNPAPSARKAMLSMYSKVLKRSWARSRLSVGDHHIGTVHRDCSPSAKGLG